jgi:hypothetical protein
VTQKNVPPDPGNGRYSRCRAVLRQFREPSRAVVRGREKGQITGTSSPRVLRPPCADTGQTGIIHGMVRGK